MSRQCMRLPERRTTSPTRGGLPPEERLRLLDDWQKRLHACIGDGSMDSGGPLRSATIGFFSRLARRFAPAISRCRCSTICSARFVRISRRIATRPGSARARLLPAIGESGRPARAPHRRLRRCARSIASSDALCTALQLTNFWQDLDATGSAAGCMFRWRRRAGARRVSAGSRRPPDRPSLAARARQRVARGPRESFRRGARGLRRCSGPSAATSCG